MLDGSLMNSTKPLGETILGDVPKILSDGLIVMNQCREAFPCLPAVINLIMGRTQFRGGLNLLQ